MKNPKMRIRGLLSRLNLTPYVFLLLPAAFYLVFFLYPVLDAFLLSFTDFKGVGERHFVGLANYQQLIRDETFLNAFRNTLIYAVVVVGALIVVPFTEALLLNQKTLGISAFRALYYLPVISSMVVAGLTWKYMLHSGGLVNGLLRQVGLIDSPVAWLADPKLALGAVMWLTIWKASPYYAVIYLAGLQSIPTELYEAALVDGASRWQLVRHITLPLIRPYTTVVAVIATIGALKVFGEVYVMTGGGPKQATYTVNFYIYQLAFRFWKMGYGSAVGVALLLIVLVFGLVNLRIFEEREPVL